MTLYEDPKKWAAPPSARPRSIDVQLYRAAYRLLAEANYRKIDLGWRAAQLKETLDQWADLTPDPPSTI